MLDELERIRLLNEQVKRDRCKELLQKIAGRLEYYTEADNEKLMRKMQHALDIVNKHIRKLVIVGWSNSQVP